MTIDKYNEQFDSCLQKEEPACTNRCPFHLDVLSFQDKIRRHKYDRAYRDYKNAVLFPDIVAALCPEYCNQVCVRKDYDGAVQLNLLERTCVAKAKRKNPSGYNLPRKEGKIGIIGGGISGLACALKLLEKKYDVIVFEKEDSIGGQLKGLLSEDIWRTDLERQFKKEKYELITNRKISDLSQLDDYAFDCIYIATGQGGNDFNYKNLDTMGKPIIFAGGSLVGKDVVMSIADGINYARAIEVYLKTGRLENPAPRKESKVVADTNIIVEMPKINPSDNGVFTDEEIKRAAERCIRCQCNACRTYCDLTEFYDQWPLEMREDINSTITSSESMIRTTPAIRLLNNCTQCGLCEEVCPPHIELNNFILEARKLQHKQEKMPAAYHGFWLDDMDHANGDKSKISKPDPKSGKCSYAFFPGCNLAAADTRYVSKTYDWLINNFDDIGLLARCCGVHADWSGNEDLHLSEVESLRNDWNELGKPILITVCPSCSKHIRKYLPEIELISLYELMVRESKWPEIKINEKIKDIEFSIFDPCSARGDEKTENALRLATKKMNMNTVDLPKGDMNGCCGYGGHSDGVGNGFGDFVAKKRADLSDNPYLTYCINCRDVFLDEGKPVLHILDILYDINGMDTKQVDLSQRRRNREKLKKELFENLWGEKMEDSNLKDTYKIEIAPEIRAKMGNLRLVDDDIRRVIDICNRLNRWTLDTDTGYHTAYAKLNYITCWISCEQKDDTYILKNVYTHRMDIILEAVFNGRKVESDLS